VKEGEKLYLTAERKEEALQNYLLVPKKRKEKGGTGKVGYVI